VVSPTTTATAPISLYIAKLPWSFVSKLPPGGVGTSPVFMAAYHPAYVMRALHDAPPKAFFPGYLKIIHNVKRLNNRIEPVVGKKVCGLSV
jgi:hypothetical protein